MKNYHEQARKFEQALLPLYKYGDCRSLAVEPSLVVRATYKIASR